MIEYVVFFSLITGAGVCLVIHELRMKQMGPMPILDYQRIKLESPIEERLYDALVFRGEIVKSQVNCGKYRIDLTLPHYGIAIECDGKAFHSTPAQKSHDRRKNAFLRKNGWKVLRFSGAAINGKMGTVLQRIEKEKY